jgi:hypothetical protein
VTGICVVVVVVVKIINNRKQTWHALMPKVPSNQPVNRFKNQA